MKVYYGTENIITVGKTETMSFFLSPRYGSGEWSSKRGEYQLPGIIGRKKVWTDEKFNNDGKHILVNSKDVALSEPLGDYGQYLGIDFIDDNGELTIRMFIYSPNAKKVNGKITPVGEVVEYIEDSFKEQYISNNDDIYPRFLFKHNGEWAAPLVSDDAEVKDLEVTIPNLIREENLTKEEQIEKYSNYYDEDGEFYYVSMYNGERNGNIYSDARLLNQVDFTINESFEGISSNGKTDFTLYEMVTVLSDGKEYSRNIYDTLMKLEGNLGKKIYSLSNVTWKIPEGSKVYGREFLDGNSSYYTWSEVGEITDEYFEIIGGRGTEAASMTFHFSDDKRTGIDDIDFDFNGTRCTVAYDNLDYKGPFLSYFLYDLDNWQEMAKSFGLTPVKRGE